MSNAHALDGYLQRDPEGWHGFPRASEADLASRYSFSPGEGRARRGLDRIDYRFRALKRPGFATPFVFYFAGDTLAFIETEFWSLDAELCAQTIAALGPPPERMDGFFRESMVASGEWLYPARGLALCVMPQTGLIARWTAFPPTSRDFYRGAIQITQPAREFEEGAAR
jgi:hypothetical protein